MVCAWWRGPWRIPAVFKGWIMKVTVEVDCTPLEARQFLGLPDVTGLNEKLMEEMQARTTANLSMLTPDELVKNWTAFGVGAQEQFMKLMTRAADMGASTSRAK